MSFLKVKRRAADNPKDAFVLASKKCKLDEKIDNFTIFKLASPAVSENQVPHLISKAIKNTDVKSHEINIEKIRKRLREEIAEHSKKSRYRLLEVLRKTGEDKDQCVPVLDVDHYEADESGSDFVYDLYYCNTSLKVDEPDFEKHYSIHELSDVWDINLDSEDEQVQDDEDDSNDENNWRNDYPDEESSEDDSMCERMQRTRLSTDNSLSSDGYDEETDDKRKKDYFDYYDEVASTSSESEGDGDISG